MRESKPIWSRRQLVATLSGVAIGAAGCSPEGDSDATAVPTDTPTPSPTATLGPIASPVAGFADPERWAGRAITVASLGGDYQAAQEEAYFDAFETATGAAVRQDTTVLADIKRQVHDDSVIWDVVCVPTEEVLPLARAGYLNPIDYGVVDTSVLLTDTGIKMQHGIGADFFSTVIVYRDDLQETPAGWADFWNLEQFEGGRALKRDPAGTLEFALIADGVPLSELYPLDVERAFASLDRIAPEVAIWYEDSKQPIELVLAAEARLASAWNVRTFLPDARGAIGITWNGGMLSGDSWVVPRGTANVNVAMSFINFATRAVPNANFCRLLPFGPVNREALGLLPQELLAVLPTANPQRRLQFVENWNYWVDHRERLSTRLVEWLESRREEDTG